MVGVAATPTMLQSLCTSAFQPCHGRRVGVSDSIVDAKMEPDNGMSQQRNLQKHGFFVTF